MNITTNFTLEEFERSQTAKNNGIENSMPARYIRNLTNLCTFVLQPLRTMIGLPIVITSGYRCRQLNELIGGSSNSQHMEGKAADIRCEDMKLVIETIKSKYVNFDQCIVYKDFIHISYESVVANRKQIIFKNK